MKNSKNILDETPFQTAGPFLHIGCMPNKIKINNLYKNDLGEVPFKNKNEIDMIIIERIFNWEIDWIDFFHESSSNLKNLDHLVKISLSF